MAIYYKPGKKKGYTDVSMHVGKDYTDEEKHEIINDAITGMYTQLQGNATNVCTYNSNLWADNLLADTLERYLKRPIDAKWEIFMQGKLERYLTSAMSLALRSSTSPFFHTYRKVYTKVVDKHLESEGGGWEIINEDDKQLKIAAEQAGEAVDELHFYDRQLIRDYFYSGYNLSEIGQKYNINAQRVGRDIKKALKKLDEILKHRIEW
jgi:RNA polymerase sigma factor (sigma-70 family)